jgi:uncharacterized protein (DUF2235 family)
LVLTQLALHYPRTAPYQYVLNDRDISGADFFFSFPQRLASWYNKAKDSAVGTTVDEHVMAGYKFLMRYYQNGDDIYFFGFSRGSYIARFLAEMLDHVGLLSAGNEELVRFVWKTFAKWQARQGGHSAEEKQKAAEMLRFMTAFRETFSRPVRRIRFLGLFDTVNSVSKVCYSIIYFT